MATLKDIAKASGVSTATVSYVVNNGPRAVLPATRDRVQKVITELGYQPNPHARALKGMRTGTVGVVFPHITNPFDHVYHGPVSEGIVVANTERHLATMLFTGFDLEEMERSASKLCDGRCDGFVVMAPMKKSRLVRELLKRNVPFVVVGTHPDVPGVTTIDSDNVQGGRAAVQHLLELGHYRIGVTPYSSLSSAASERVQGYRAALKGAKIPVDEHLITPFPEEDPDGPKRVVFGLLADPETRPSAIFTTQDGMALNAYAAAEELGVRIPEELSIVGFDDIQVSANLTPPLTTMRQPMRDIGQKAVELLYERIEDPDTPAVKFQFTPQIIERASTARPRPSNA